MSRVEKLNEKYRLAKDGFQNGNNEIVVSPYFWSIYHNNRVLESSNSSQAVGDNPRFIISAFVHHYFSYGRRQDAHIICYRNSNSDSYFTGIELSKWKLTKVAIWSCERIEEATFERIDNFEEGFTFHFDSIFPVNSMQLLWKLFVEIDSNCNTKKEAEFYFNYFLKKLEVENANLTIDEYKNTLNEKNNLLKQYDSLLSKIENLVNP